MYRKDVSTVARRSAFRAFQAALLTFFTCCLCLAQSTNSADIRGTVTDASGATLPGVAVTLQNTETGVTKELVTNSAGLYDAVSILPGRYRITYTKEGFQKVIREGITVQVGAISVDAQLSVGAVQQQVDVTAESPLLQTETAEQSSTLETATLAALPDVGKNWQNFMIMLPGASGAPMSNAGASNPGVSLAINGTLPYYSSFLADGSSIRLPHSANIDSQISEAVAEVQVSASTFSAQYGGGGDVFNVISKSGTNQWHGSGYEYFQNDALNARSFFDGQKAARQRYNNFGGSVGGAILKNKMFFYFDIDKIVNPNLTTVTTTVPTAAVKQGYFDPAVYGVISNPTTGTPYPGNQIPVSSFDPVAAAIQKYYPDPNIAGLTTNNYRFLQTGTNPSLREFGRLDYNFSSKDRLTFSITERTSTGTTGGTSCPINCQSSVSDSYQAQVSEVHTVSPSIVNEFRFGFVRQGNWILPSSLGLGYPQKIGLQYAKADIFPTINVTGIGATNVLQPQTSAIYLQNGFNPSDVITMIRGRHILHFGGEALISQDNSTPWGNLTSGNFTFTGQFTNSSAGYADFLLGDVQAWSALSQGKAGMRSKNPSFFAQDDIKIRPNLTLNVGLRWEIHGGFSEVNHQEGSFDPTITNPVTNTPGAIWFDPNHGRDMAIATVYDVFLPRIGVAWSPTSAWSVRGGFGEYASLWSMDVDGSPLGFGTANRGNISANPGQAPVVTLSGTGANLPFVQASRDPGAYNGQGGLPYQPYHTPVGRIYQWTASIERQLGWGTVLEAAYVGSRGTGLQFQADINQVPANKLGGGQAARPYPQYLNIGPSVPGGLTGLYNNISNYHALQVRLRKRLSYGLSGEVNYTWSKMLDDQDTSGWGSHYGGAPYQDAYNPSANYGLSNFDTPHMFKGYLVYELPAGKGHKLLSSGIGDAVLGGWQASSLFIVQSGAPFTVTMSSNTNSGALDGSWYPNVVGDPHVKNPTINEWFNQLAYATPATNTFGNSGRNTLRGPDLTEVNLSLSKRFIIPRFERGGVEVRMDATNILNHPSFGLPNSSLSSAALAAGVPNPSVGQITTTTVPGRVIQLSGRFSF